MTAKISSNDEYGRINDELLETRLDLIAASQLAKFIEELSIDRDYIEYENSDVLTRFYNGYHMIAFSRATSTLIESAIERLERMQRSD